MHDGSSHRCRDCGRAIRWALERCFSCASAGRWRREPGSGMPAGPRVQRAVEYLESGKLACGRLEELTTEELFEVVEVLRRAIAPREPDPGTG